MSTYSLAGTVSGEKSLLSGGAAGFDEDSPRFGNSLARVGVRSPGHPVARIRESRCVSDCASDAGVRTNVLTPYSAHDTRRAALLDGASFPRWAAAQGRFRFGRASAAPLRAPLRAEKSGFWQPGSPVPRCGKLPTWGFAARDRDGGVPRRRNGGKDCQNPDFPAHGEAGTRRRGRSRPTPRPEAGPRSSAWRYAPNGGSERVSHVKHSGFSTAPCGEGRSGRFPERIAAAPAAR